MTDITPLAKGQVRHKKATPLQHKPPLTMAEKRERRDAKREQRKAMHEAQREKLRKKHGKPPKP